MEINALLTTIQQGNRINFRLRREIEKQLEINRAHFASGKQTENYIVSMSLKEFKAFEQFKTNKEN